MNTDSRFILHNSIKSHDLFGMTYQHTEYQDVVFVLRGSPETCDAELLCITENDYEKIDYRFTGTWKDLKLEGFKIMVKVLLDLKMEASS